MKIIHILESQKRNLIEASEENYDFLYDAKEGDDITDVIKKYFSYSIYGERDPMFSKIAANIHERLMYTLCLWHEETESRKLFASIMTYVKSLFNRGIVQNIEIGHNYTWRVNLLDNDDIDLDYISINKNYFEDDSDAYRYAIVFKTQDGIKHLKNDFHDGSNNGSTGYYTSKAVMTDEMKEKIIGMGLVPAIMESGSYHENWLYSVGVLPEYVSKVKRGQNDSFYGEFIFFDCKFGF